jgi:hypothetical protein
MLQSSYITSAVVLVVMQLGVLETVIHTVAIVKQAIYTTEVFARPVAALVTMPDHIGNRSIFYCF